MRESELPEVVGILALRVCPQCRGKRHADGRPLEPCHRCKGAGNVTQAITIRELLQLLDLEVGDQDP